MSVTAIMNKNKDYYLMQTLCRIMWYQPHMDLICEQAMYNVTTKLLSVLEFSIYEESRCHLNFMEQLMSVITHL